MVEVVVIVAVVIVAAALDLQVVIMATVVDLAVGIGMDTVEEDMVLLAVIMDATAGDIVAQAGAAVEASILAILYARC